MIKKWMSFSLSYLVILAFLGVVLRSFPMFDLAGLTYAHILHAHSHVALLGWVYVSLVLLLSYKFLPAAIWEQRSFIRMLSATQIIVIGMVISFILQGYNIVSIILSTLHIIVSYWFIVLFLKNYRKRFPYKSDRPLSVSFAKASLFFLFISSLGPWGLSGVRRLEEQGFLYDAFLHFYLFMQYNGWFTLALLALLLSVLETRTSHNSKRWTLIFWLYCIGLIPAFLVMLLASTSHVLIQVGAGLGSIMTWISIALVIVYVFKQRQYIKYQFTGWARYLLWLSLLALISKSSMELMLNIPLLNDYVHQTYNVIIAYLHLMLIGFVSFLILAFFIHEKWIFAERFYVRLGFRLFVIGFILNVGYLFLHSLLWWLGLPLLPKELEVLFLSSILLFVGTVCVAYRTTKI